MIKSPYNFVPAPTEDQVFKPEWADQVSHDIPFSDGESGEIEFTITAETPIFIRNGHSKDKATSEFSHIGEGANKRYFIPSTSIKGMIRNVMEIMSFSRMKQVDDNQFSIRDLSSNNNYYMNQMKSTEGNKTHCGWLKQDKNGNWSILDCGEPGRINHLELKEKLGLGFREEFLNKEPKNDEAKSAKYKYYEAYKQKNFSLRNKFKTIRQDTRLKAFFHSEGDDGTIVFTGQPGKRKELGEDKTRHNGKFYEFVFFEKENSVEIDISLEQQKIFKFIYKDSDRDNISPDWNFWREKLKKGEHVPVFFKKTGKKIQHFGLSYLYKLPLENSILKTAPMNSYKKDTLDFSEVVFGMSNAFNSLKGRVFFSNAFADNVNVGKEVKEIFGAPKASYLPFYLDQTKKEGLVYSNYNSGSVLRGNKRYPVSQKIRQGKYSEKQLDKKSVFSNFIPLNQGTTFSGKVRFHNLKREELGALISSISFHNNPGFSHSIGGAKPFGYGRVKMEIATISDRHLNTLFHFENCLNNHVSDKIDSKLKWIETDQIKELFSMAKTSDNEDFLCYPELEIVDYQGKKSNEFVYYKQQGWFLHPYSLITNTKDIVKSQINTDSKEFKEAELKKQAEANAKLSNQNQLYGNFGKFSELSKYLNEEYGTWHGFTSENKNWIIERIRDIYFNHKDSRKKLEKAYDWENNISKWLGHEKAVELRSSLIK